MIYIFLVLLILILIFYVYYKQIISIANSHFGTNLTTKESDSTNKSTKNFISGLYDDQVDYDYQNSPFQSYLEPESVPEIDISELTMDKFIYMTNNFTTPLVVRGFLKETPAVKQWNLDFFANNYGDTKLPVIENADINKHKDYISSYNTEKYNYITMRDFVNSVKNGEKMYINNVSRIFGYHPELLNYLELEKIKEYTGEDIKDEVHITNLFFGGKGTGTSLHCSITGNFFYNIKGNKHWYFIDPKYSEYLKPLLSRTGLFAVSQLDICAAKKGDYPLNIPRFEVVLDEGDLLFNPPWFWHAISNESAYTIACANRFTNFWSALNNNLLYTTIFYSHPIANYNDFGKFETRKEANIEFDKALLSDILKDKELVK